VTLANATETCAVNMPARSPVNDKAPRKTPALSKSEKSLFQ